MPKIEIREGQSIVIIPPEGPKDTLAVMLVSEKNITRASFNLDANQAAEFIRWLKDSFVLFHG